MMNCCLRFILFGPSMLLTTNAVSTNKGQIYVTTDGKTCFKCSPGTYKVLDCQEARHQARCEDCPDGYYQTDYNIAIYCSKCKTHCIIRNQEKVHDCTDTEDMQCQCRRGHYYLPTGLGEGKCLELSLCPAGQGVTGNGSRTEDTQCSPCISGETFSPNQSVLYCSSCTSCATFGKEELTLCNVTHDAVCTNPTPDGKTNIPMLAGITGCCFILLLLAIIYFIYSCCRRPKCSNQKVMYFTPNTDLNHDIINILKEDSMVLNKWRDIGRRLGIGEGKLVAIERNYPNNIQEQVHQMMLFWKKTNGKRATSTKLIEALRQDMFIQCAENIEAFLQQYSS